MNKKDKVSINWQRINKDNSDSKFYGGIYMRVDGKVRIYNTCNSSTTLIHVTKKSSI